MRCCIYLAVLLSVMFLAAFVAACGSTQDIEPTNYSDFYRDGSRVNVGMPESGYKYDQKNGRGCSRDDDCSGDRDYCDFTTRACVECKIDDHCPQGMQCVDLSCR